MLILKTKSIIARITASYPTLTTLEMNLKAKNISNRLELFRLCIKICKDNFKIHVDQVHTNLVADRTTPIEHQTEFKMMPAHRTSRYLVNTF